jgi:small nuclear ribonucleoprotein (snRNP)-like protein
MSKSIKNIKEAGSVLELIDNGLKLLLEDCREFISEDGISKLEDVKISMIQIRENLKVKEESCVHLNDDGKDVLVKNKYGKKCNICGEQYYKKTSSKNEIPIGYYDDNK